jgi:hypothetical protein
VRANGAGLMPASVEALLQYRAKLESMYEPFEGEQAISTIHGEALNEGGMEPRPLRASLDAIFRAGD